MRDIMYNSNQKRETKHPATLDDADRLSKKPIVDLMVHGLYILPQSTPPTTSQDNLLKNHTLVIHNGKIKDKRPTKEAKQRYTAKHNVERQNHIIMPGLVNAHTHSPMVLFRGLADDLALQTWLEQHIWPAEQRWLSPDFIRDGMSLAIAEMIKGGTTCFNEHYFFPKETADICLRAGIRACIGTLFIDVPTAFAKDEQAYLDQAQHFIETCPKHNLITPTLAPHAPYTLKDRSLRGIADLAKRYKHLPIHVHMHETAQEITDSLQQHGKRPLQRFFEHGLLSRRTLNVHMTQINAEDIDLLKQTGAHVVTCPHSNLKLASGFCPIHTLQKAGINLAIGTDGAASNNSLDLLAELKTCALLAKALAQDPTALSAHQAIYMATMGGAKALGLDDQIGSLCIGKSADCIAINLDHPSSQPCYHPAAQIVYAVSRDQVNDVWVEGRPLLTQGKLTTLSEKAIREQTFIWQKRLR